jgi:peptide/nickel transport system substrate-binding protein
MPLKYDRQTGRTIHGAELIRASALICSGALLLVACSEKSQRPSGPATNGTLVIATSGEVKGLFPPLMGSVSSRQIEEQIYDYLAVVGPDLNTFGDKGFLPRLAESWTWSGDSLSIAFKINSRARWHDGVAADAADVRYTYGVYTNPAVASPDASELSNIDSVTTPDSRTATFWYHSRSAYQLLDATQMMILPRHLFERIPMDSLKVAGPVATPIGTGRFRFKRSTSGSSLEVIADTANYRGRPGLDRVIWTFAPVGATAVTKLLGGEADMFAALKPEDVSAAKRSNLNVTSIRSTDYVFLAFNLRKPVFGSRELRRALTMAIDRVSLVTNVYDTLASVAIGPTARVFPTTDTTLRQIPFDPSRAKAILDSLGWRATSSQDFRTRNGNALAFSLLVPSSSPLRVRFAVLIQGQLRRIGVDAQIEQMEFNSFNHRVDSRDFDAVIWDWRLGATPNSVRGLWGTASARNTGGSNFGSYQNAHFDSYVDSAIAARTPAAARMYFRAAYQIIIDDAPAIWLAEPKTVIGLHRRIRTGPMRADAWWFDLGSWTIPKSAQIDRDRIPAGQ